ncbi:MULTISPECIES: hypothetical protein [unclassified Sphingomonas]|uniref:hypothetical protein n=1 Tax=unclassified Sphingomonas TaxID=196159 RepID=UPI00226A6164|nr:MULTISPECIES: hypothetical protein [unclassified Sphingomonas]
MITLAFLLAQATDTVSLAQIRAMPPVVAGDVILRDQQHGPIEAFESPTGGMNAPGMIDGQLVERPTATGPGCVRTRWTVKFQAAPGADISAATVIGTYPTREISWILGNVCPSGEYVHLNPGISVDQGWEALTGFRQVSAVASRTKYKCADTTSSGLCKGNKAISAALRTLAPWAITQDADEVRIWLGVPGDVVTEVRFDLKHLSQVVVTRKVPAPF